MHDASRYVLYLLETVEVPLRSAVQEAVAIIDPSTDNGSCHQFCRLKGERWSQMSQWPKRKVEITRTDDIVNCWSNDTEVSSVTPSSLTTSENWICTLATLMVWLKSMPTSRCQFANNTASVLLRYKPMANRICVSCHYYRPVPRFQVFFNIGSFPPFCCYIVSLQNLDSSPPVISHFNYLAVNARNCSIF